MKVLIIFNKKELDKIEEILKKTRDMGIYYEYFPVEDNWKTDNIIINKISYFN